ncbi:MAG TPA: hypothetical protein VF600_05235 [Abditibacteriaceae bacterium]|jgi:hypothetical protein
MSEGANPLAGIVGFWMLMQLASTLALLLGGIYGLYCLSRAASGMERLAAAVERLVAERATPNLQMPMAPRDAQSANVTGAVPPVSSATTYPAATPQPFVPQVSPDATATTVPTAPIAPVAPGSIPTEAPRLP